MHVSSACAQAPLSHQTLLSKQKSQRKIQNFKMVPAEHSTKPGALLSAEPCATSHAHEASPGKRALELGDRSANVFPTCLGHRLTPSWPTSKDRRAVFDSIAPSGQKRSAAESTISKANGKALLLEGRSQRM